MVLPPPPQSVTLELTSKDDLASSRKWKEQRDGA